MGRRKKGGDVAVAALIVLTLMLALVVLRWIWSAGCRLYAYYRSRNPDYQVRQSAMLQTADITRMHPVDFEDHCAAILKAQGWACKTTRTSGDFGVDIIADRQRMRVVIQVKKWQAPVNLNAVQEAAAGRPLYRAHVAAVVSVSGYRRSAIELALANRVLLLSYSDLYDFSRRVPARLD